MPARGMARLTLTRELHELVAIDEALEVRLKTRYHLLQKMLASNPLSVFQIVPLATSGANGRFTITARSHLSVRLAGGTDDLELRAHGKQQ